MRSVLAVNLCSSGPLLTATCDHESFVITVDEACRAAEYDFVDWTKTFVDGVITNVDLVAADIASNSQCGVVAVSNQFEYDTLFSQCNIIIPTTASDADENGITWYTYTIYLNFDSPITSDGTGNVQQLGQTQIDCKVPANVQENGAGEVTISDPDIIEDQVNEVPLWSSLQLDVDKGGSGNVPAYTGTPLSSGDAVGLGEHVKLTISGEATTNYE